MSVTTSSIPKDVTVDNLSLEASDNVIGVKDDGITEPKIKDGEIVNVDINSTAKISPSKLTQFYSISDDVLKSHDGQVVVDYGSMTKVKTITLDTLKPSPITLRIHLEVYIGGGGGTCRAQIYKNGIAFGTIRATSTEGTWYSHNEDLEFEEGDTLELWGYGTASSNVRNFRILGKDDLLSSIPDGVSVTNS